jgi:hypothetical protein
VRLEWAPVRGIRAAFAAARPGAGLLRLTFLYALTGCERDSPDNIAAQAAAPSASAAQTAGPDATGVLATPVSPRLIFPLNRSERSCGMTRPDEKSEASVQLDVGAGLRARKRAVECLREAHSRYFAGEAVSLALRLVDEEPCPAIGLVHSAMAADLSKSQIGTGEAESWAAANAARFTSLSGSRLEALAARALTCFPAAPKEAEAAGAALLETARRLRSGNLTNAGIGSGR